MRYTVYCILCVIVTFALGLLSMRYVTRHWLLTFFGSAQIHLAFACAILAALALVVRPHWYAGALLLVSAGLAAHSFMMLREHAAPALGVVSAEGSPLRLLSFNIDTTNLENGGRIADEILASQADIVAIYEAASLPSEMERLSKIYPYRIGCGVKSEDCDSLVMSKRPFLRQEMRDLDMLWRNRLIVATMEIDGKPLTLVSAHLSKPYFDAFHRDELAMLHHVLDEIEGPVILAGDFNASVLAPDMRFFLTQTGLRHAFPEPSTWPVAAGNFGISIDHVFVRTPVEIQSVRRIPDNMGSNHYGLVTDVILK
ncbi:endonuclease/exonuclease/phosphatase family protein [Rhizobium sp. RAF56]|uniref:endonuclease/exonuclease/phosphatase family protein n=1 Tax=Rhizobium sp. RAF56 TaxID=3233062 RepID=UPI003F990DE9